MGRRKRDQGKLFYEFRLEDWIPGTHLLRRMNVLVAAVLKDLHKELAPFYADTGRPSVDPELMIRMLIVGYCYGIRSERRLCQEVELHLAYRWFCKLDLEDAIPHHSTFSVNRLGRFRGSDALRYIFERVVRAAMAKGLVKGEGFAVDASVLEANASRYHGKAPDELDWTDAQRQKRAVAEYLAGLDAEAHKDDTTGTNPDEGSHGKPDRKTPKVISPSDPSSAWTAKANKRVQFMNGEQGRQRRLAELNRIGRYVTHLKPFVVQKLLRKTRTVVAGTALPPYKIGGFARLPERDTLARGCLIIEHLIHRHYSGDLIFRAAPAIIWGQRCGNRIYPEKGPPELPLR